MTQKLHLEVRKAFECPWSKVDGGHGTHRGSRFCDHPVSPVNGCDKPNEPPPAACPIRKAPVLVEVPKPDV